MSDQSLMNPDFLNQELVDLDALVTESEEFADAVHADIDRIIDYVRDTYNAGEPTTLSKEQVQDLIVTLSNIDLNRWRYSSPRKLARNVYSQLKTDRRWIIASKLNFLKK